MKVDMDEMLKQEKLKHEMRELYKKLSQNISAYLNKEHPVTLFPMKGTEYPNRNSDNSKRFMLIGRALNGWYEGSNFENAEDYAENALKAVQAEDRFEWVSKSSYLLSKSAFWRTGRRVYEGLVGHKADDNWYENIVWSNLYPVAMNTGGNPSSGMAEAQLETARELLQCHIEFYKPTHILFETGWDYWFHVSDEVGFFIADYREDNTHKDVLGYAVESIGTIGDAKAVIAKRPERIKNGEEEYAKDIIKAFNYLGKIR